MTLARFHHDSSPPHRRPAVGVAGRGFTIVELLTSLLAIVVLIGLVIHASTSVRRGADRASEMASARSLGIGSVLTTLHPEVMERVYSMLSIPEDIQFHGCLPLGYPRGKFGSTARLPTAATTYWDTWDSSPPWA